MGAVVGFGKGDLFCPYREHVLALARGIDPKLIMAELFGKFTGVSKGKGDSMHPYEPKMDFYGGKVYERSKSQSIPHLQKKNRQLPKKKKRLRW